MTAREIEERIELELTQAFIAQDPVDLVIQRADRASDGAGGSYPVEPEVIAEATFRLIPQSRNVIDRTATSINGRLESPRYVIMAETDVFWRRGDFFDWRGDRYSIASVHMFPAYEHKADVILTSDLTPDQLDEGPVDDG